MAKKGQKIVLENVELKPQVIGLAYRKKSNIGHVIFIFIALGLAIYYINDISVFINDLLGRETAKTIQSGTTNKDKDKDEDKGKGNEGEEKETIYNEYSPNLEIEEKGLTLKSFNIANNTLSFQVVNNSSSSVDLTSHKYFLELYDENKTLMNRFKVDFNTINSQANVNFSFNVPNSNIKYVVLVEKTVDDYPDFNLSNGASGLANLVCVNGNDNLVYNFRNNELKQISHTVTDNNISDSNYNTRLLSMQSKVTNYNGINGISALININELGYTAVFNIDLEEANMSNINEKYYYKHLEKAKVIKFEMETYGFSCE